MPTYEYKCRVCDNRFEKFKSMNDPEARCPVCGAEASRLISVGGGLIFKGSGFYITEHRSAEYKRRAAGERETARSK